MDEHTEATLTDCILATWPYENLRPRYIAALQVHNGAGFNYSRKLDAIVLDTWPGAGLALHGLEIKVTTTDLRRELQQPEKMGEFLKHLDLFSIVAPAGIVDLILLAPQWGLYTPTSDGKLRARRKPLPLHPGEKRESISKTMFAAFTRSLVDRSLSRAGLHEEYKRGQAEADIRWKVQTVTLSAKAEGLQKAIEEFEQASGVRIHAWDARRIGEAVKVVLHGGIEARIGYSTTIRDVAARMLKLADELDALKVAFGG